MTTTLGSDAFTRANSASTMGTADVGGAWTAGTGTWGIISNTAYCAAGVVGDVALATLNAGVADCTVEVTIAVEGTSGFSGLMLRSNNTNAQGFSVYNNFLWDEGTGAQFGPTFTGGPFVSGDRMRAVMGGTTITVYRQVGAVGSWTQVFTATSSSYLTNTRHGLFIWSTGATNARFDDFLITVADTYMPDTKVEVAFDSGYATPAASRTWTDVSTYVELTESDTIKITRGRPDEFGNTEPNKLDLVLDNSDGRFTAENASSPYYPNVKIGRPIRVTTTLGGVDYIRFVGYIDEWPVEWVGSSNRSLAQITAQSRMARLGNGVELRSMSTEEINDQAPHDYWTLGEPAGASRAQSEIADISNLVNADPDNPVVFGGEAGLIESSDTGVTFSTIGDGFLRGELSSSVHNSGGDAIAVSAWIHGPLDSSGFYIKLIGDAEFSGPTGVYTFRLKVTAGGTYEVSINDVEQTEIMFASFGPNNDASGTAQHVAGVLDTNAGKTRLTLYVDSDPVSTVTHATTDLGLSFDMISVGFNVNDTVSHVVVDQVPQPFDTDILFQRFLAGYGAIGDTTTARFERYARYAGIPSAEYSMAASEVTVYAVDINGTAALEAMRRIELAEGGVLFDAKDNTLTMQLRNYRYGQAIAPAFTLDAAMQQVEEGVNPKLDRSALTNEVTVTGPQGVSTVTVADQASIDEYGISRTSIETLAYGLSEVDGETQPRADWLISLYSTPHYRVPSVGVDFLALPLATQQAILGAEISSVMSITGLPAQSPASTLTQFIEGYAEEIGSASYTFDFNVSSSTGYAVWTVEDPVYGAYDSNPLAY
jgi:hypothetical protein